MYATGGDILALNQGTLYPLLLKLEHEGSIVSQWGASENNRRARFYRLTTTASTFCVLSTTPGVAVAVGVAGTLEAYF
jgi:hypothetical protein